MILTERYKDQIAGIISSYDRLVIQGILLRKFIPDFSPSSITRILKRLLLHGLKT